MANSYDNKKDRWAVAVSPTPSFPSRNAKVVTPSDSKDLTDATGDNLSSYAKALYVGGTGNVTVIMAASQDDSVTVLLTAVPAGTILPIQVRRVLATGTTATAIAALFD